MEITMRDPDLHLVGPKPDGGEWQPVGEVQPGQRIHFEGEWREVATVDRSEVPLSGKLNRVWIGGGTCLYRRPGELLYVGAEALTPTVS